MKKTGLLLLFIFMTGVSLNSATIWVDRDIYVADRNLKIGDIIVVNVKDFSRLKFDIALVNNSSSNVESNPDVTITGFLPKVSSNKNTKNNESTNFTGSSKIELAVASRIVELQDNGNSVISGTRTYTFNGVTSTLSVTGIVDPKHVSGGLIDSEFVADFRIQITGRKEGLTIRKAQIGQDETSSSELTETEKQQIIIDYLEKIIRELTR
ncbi:MAG TPA: flagellar basal body L-ring protein FlgH [Spirochaetota bacterium]|nr:flagellar basal body L-ring protein FlgH [Spirochaetota bacterium]HPF06316.1 flagellar basal body L-ring protein FlgH [Spirochaetota bacterium]HPJ40914.1 flagellar basal body L-ring protein FlgH [Spirochaetota bacterium]HPR37738.1 flagellar basal body L-ring protein FlgH [Spirochaetota bacterium]HRX47751.1 flagellar basal body L-ring protein FlgH [Spirochaetota bacterium]